MKVFVLLSLCSLSYISLLAQGDFRPGYIVTVSGDSISGLIDYRLKPSSVFFFKHNKRSKKISYGPDQILRYGFVNGKRFVSRKIQPGDQNIFFEQLIGGTMSLLRLKEVFYIEDDTIIELPRPTRKLIQTENGTKIHEGKLYVGILNYRLFDCGLKAEKTKYDERPLSYLIQNYNRCKGKTGVVYKEKLSWSRFDFQLSSGLDITKLQLDGFDRGISPVYGVSLDISSPRVFDRLFFSVEAFYTQKLFQGYSEFGNIRNDHIIRLNQIKLPFGVRYSFFESSQSPFVKMGIVNYVVTKSSWDILSEFESNGVVTTQYLNIGSFNRILSSAWASVGYNKTVYDRFMGFVEFRYESGRNESPISSSINVIVGVRF